jgi:hypothetical protein
MGEVALSEMQTLVLWALLVQTGGCAFQKDIRPEVKKADREALVRTGLITVEKRGRGLWLEATDKGWSWAAEHLDAELPKRATAGGAILQAWLTRLKAFLASRDLVLADVLGAQQLAKATGEPPSHSHIDYETLRGRIRSAYLDITGGQLNTPVQLSDLRERLRDIDRVAIDEALRRMHLEQGTTLSGLNNPHEIMPAIREAALTFKGEPMYVLWIVR